MDGEKQNLVRLDHIDRVIGSELRRLRLLRGLSQPELGKQLYRPVHASTICKVENGILPIEVKRFLDLSFTLGTSPTGLLNLAIIQVTGD